DHWPEHPALPRRRAHDDLHRHPDDRRYHPHDDGREARYPGAREPDVRLLMRLRGERGRVSDGGGGLPARHPRPCLQHSPEAAEGGGARMTTTPPPMLQAPVNQPPARSFRRRMSNPIGSAIAIVIAILWTLPTFGLFISSFRPEADVKTSGWWTFFANPSFTLENYDTILFGRSSTWSLLDYIVNSEIGRASCRE